MKIYAFIFARGGSVGCKNKNIRLLGDKPLIAHTIELAKTMPEITKIIVSTDSDTIIDIAKKYGASIIIKRPDYLCTSEANELDSWKHAIHFLKEKGDMFDLFVSLPCIAPLRKSIDVTNCIEKFLSDESDLLVTTTKDEKMAWAAKIDTNGYIIPFVKKSWTTRRQDFKEDIRLLVPMCYVSTLEHILNINHVLDGKVSTYLIPYDRSIDIDNEIDFKIAEVLFKNNIIK